MGKDIDRNITRQLWERLKNTFTNNDIIPVKNGGTGENNLKLFYPKIVEDNEIMEINIKNIPLEPGFTLQPGSNAIFTFNNKSMYVEGEIHIKRDTDNKKSEFIKFTIPKISGYNINNIKIGDYRTLMSINNNIFTLKGLFGANSEYHYSMNRFIPFI